MVGLVVGFEVLGLQDWMQTNLVSQPQSFLTQYNDEFEGDHAHRWGLGPWGARPVGPGGSVCQRIFLTTQI